MRFRVIVCQNRAAEDGFNHFQFHFDVSLGGANMFCNKNTFSVVKCMYLQAWIKRIKFHGIISRYSSMSTSIIIQHKCPFIMCVHRFPKMFTFNLNSNSVSLQQSNCFAAVNYCLFECSFCCIS